MENIFDVKRKVNNIYEVQMKIVAYLRLSREDGDGESSSISNQRRIIEKFALDRGYVVSEWYIDDGYSGYTMDRPEFNKLRRDLNNGTVDIVIFKDLSRLSRHNANAQLFLENIQAAGKRVLTIHEGYDTLDPKTHKMVGIYGWMNEDYIRDSSMKTKEAIKALQQEGIYINSIPYGYIKDPIKKHAYDIDPITSPYVKQIFDLYISGMGFRAISDKLNRDNIPTFQTVNKQRLESMGKNTKYTISLWNSDTVQRIITNDFYIGTLTLNKTVRRTINGKRSMNPSEQHYVFENAHNPIIDKQTFKLAQEIYAQRKKIPYRGTKINRPNIFSGLLRCADCGKNFTSATKSDNTRYVCSVYNKQGTNFCTSHAIMEYQIKDVLIAFLKDCRVGLAKILEDFDVIFTKEFNKQGDLQGLEKDLERTKRELKVLMEQKMRETLKNPGMSDIIDDMYNEAMNEKYKMISYIEKQIEDTVNIEAREKDVKKNFKSTINMLDDILNTKELTKKQVLILVDYITVYEDGSLDIYLKGDLHELCNNKINIQKSLQDTLSILTTEYILEHKDHISPSKCWKYICDNDVKISYIKFSKYLNGFAEDGIIFKMPNRRQGYKFILDDETLKSYTNYNNVVATIGGRCNNDVTLDMIIAISELGSIYSSIDKKLLF